MWKHCAIALLLSVVVIFFLKDLVPVLQFLLFSHNLIANFLAKIFAGGEIGTLIRQAIALVIIPLGIACVPLAFYNGILRRDFVYFADVFWVTWIILLAALTIR